MSKKFTPYFMSEFHDRLLKPNGTNPVRDRASGFKKIFEILDSVGRNYYQILETGCMRPDHGEMCFGDDGCSTVIFDSFVSQMGGHLYSVDINPINVEYSKKHVSKHTSVICSDSVKWIYGVGNSVHNEFDLVYLDSFDITKENPHPSMLHHLKELCAVLKNTCPGTIIAVDDHNAFFDGKIGKGNYVKSFLDDIGAKCIHEGYQLIYQIQ